MLRAAYGLLRDSGRVFLEAAPAGLHPDEIGQLLTAQPHVRAVHDLHVWEITSGSPALSAHVLLADDCDCRATRNQLAQILHERCDIDHATLQVDPSPPAPTGRRLPTRTPPRLTGRIGGGRIQFAGSPSERTQDAPFE